MRALLALFLGLAMVSPGWARPGAEPLSARVADYAIEVHLDPELRELTGRQRLTWRNSTDRPADELRFHLYWNGFRNERSTWMREARIEGDLPDEIRPQDWGWIEVDAIRLRLEGGEVGLASRYAAPDDGNRDDRTVLVVPLPAPVAPGESVEVAMDWRARVPRVFARTGVRDEYYFVGHWFPKVGVWEGDEGWSCHQFHANTEFFSDYGVYEVEITTPARFVVGATGREVERRDGPEGTVVRRFEQSDVHGFAWTAFPDYLEATDRFEAPGLPPVELRLLYPPEHAHLVARHLTATRVTLEGYGRWFGPYPYDHLTIVDPVWRSGTGGMEYPTLFTTGTRVLAPPEGQSPEGVTVHEAGHQFWYGVVGNDEITHAWLDEGLNTYSTERLVRERWGDEAWVERYLAPPGPEWTGFLPRVFPGVRYDPWDVRLERLRKWPQRDVLATPTWRYYPESHGTFSYSKAALSFVTLERYLGWETMREILATYYARYAFRHPEPEDLFVIADEVARERNGEELAWFWDQVYRDTAVFDVAVIRAESFPDPGEGYFEGEEGLVLRQGAASERFRSEVVVARRGRGAFPVDLLLVFADGSERRERWDPRESGERWHLWVHEGPSRLVEAVVDPERVLALDLHPVNNALLVESAAPRAAVKWASKWSIWFQDLLMSWSFFL